MDFNENKKNNVKQKRMLNCTSTLVFLLILYGFTMVYYITLTGLTEWTVIKLKVPLSHKPSIFKERSTYLEFYCLIARWSQKAQSN